MQGVDSTSASKAEVFSTPWPQRNKKDITTNNKNINTIQTQTQHKVNMKKDEKPIKQMENIPSCFEKAYCHIRRFLKNQSFNSKTMMQCGGCVHDDQNNFPKNFIGRQAVKISTWNKRDGLWSEILKKWITAAYKDGGIPLHRILSYKRRKSSLFMFLFWLFQFVL